MSSELKFPGRLGLQQRVLPSYRAPFFEMLAAACAGGMSLFAGQPRAEESIETASTLHNAQYTQARNIHLFKGPYYFCYQRGLMDWLSEWNPDALVVEANPRYLSTPPAIKWMQKRGRPVLGWGLGAPPPSTSPHFLGKGGERQREGLRMRFLGQFDALIAYSQRGADQYAALGFPHEKIFVAHNSVSPKPSREPAEKPITTEQTTVLFVGRLQARKGVSALLRACAELPKPKPRLVIVGDGPEVGTLKQAALRFYPSAMFVGAKYGDELRPYFDEADLFVLPGTGGLAVQEAMGHGLPVIVGKGDGTQDDLVRSENGWQVPPGDFDALVASMREALSDVQRLREKGRESFRIVSEEINLEKMVETFVRALNSVS